jgi:hypothetical protein
VAVLAGGGFGAAPGTAAGAGTAALEPGGGDGEGSERPEKFSATVLLYHMFGSSLTEQPANSSIGTGRKSHIFRQR